MFEAAKLRCLRCQEDLSFEIFGLPSAGTMGGPWEEEGPSQTPFTVFWLEELLKKMIFAEHLTLRRK